VVPAEGKAASAERHYKCGKALVASDQSSFLEREYSAWKAKWVRAVDGGKCVLRWPGDVSGNLRYPGDCVSEGNGYGMLISAYMQDKESFDGFWSFWKKYQDQKGNMNWQIWPRRRAPSLVVGSGSATDADEDGAMALLVAAEHWGEPYASLAKEQIERVWASDIDPSTGMWRPGDGWGGCETIDVSYFAPAWYEAFAQATGNKEWQRVIDWGFEFLGKCNRNNMGTGLTPQWTNCECSKSGNIGKYPDKYWCDASRLPWRMGMSAAWYCNEGAQTQVDLLVDFFSKQGGAADIQNGYTLDGTPLHTSDTDNACTSSCFASMVAAAHVASDSNATVKADFWNVTGSRPGPGQSCYYCDALRLLSILFTSGRMKAPTVKL